MAYTVQLQLVDLLPAAWGCDGVLQLEDTWASGQITNTDNNLRPVDQQSLAGIGHSSSTHASDWTSTKFNNVSLGQSSKNQAMWS